ncbi:lipocalin-like isoform X3 [Ascaphus truei]|uniref:lipocalin-like isoform X3 n=1 Tax=Ascaphus truei TaxID=8439 RepID=UPI003F59DDB5
MKGLPLSLGLVALFALCAVCAQSDIPVQPDFQADKIVGKWYRIAVASNSNWLQPNKLSMKMGPTVITQTADGNLGVVVTHPIYPRVTKRVRERHHVRRIDTDVITERWNGLIHAQLLQKPVLHGAIFQDSNTVVLNTICPGYLLGLRS